MQRWFRVSQSVLVPEDNIGSIQIETEKLSDGGTKTSLVILLKSGEVFTPVSERYPGVNCLAYLAAVQQAILHSESMIIDPSRYYR